MPRSVVVAAASERLDAFLGQQDHDPQSSDRICPPESKDGVERKAGEGHDR
jgi:hypothetical protein